MGKAQNAYAALLRDHLAPALRSLGFRGSRGAYTLPHPDYWVRIGVQSSAWNSSEEVKFTLNLTAMPKAGWERLRRAFPSFPEQPEANGFYNSPALGDSRDLWQSRIGGLLPPKTDRWWTLRPDSDLSAVAADVMSAVLEGALPAITRETGVVFAS